MIGIVSVTDLMNRPEIGTVPAKSWLQRLLTDDAVLARDHIRSYSHQVTDVMTTNVVTADEHTDLREIATLMQLHRVKRIPIVRGGLVVEIVSQSNLLQGLLSREPYPAAELASDESLRASVAAEFASHAWAFRLTNVVVEKGVVHIWGYVDARPVRNAIGLAAEKVPGVRRVVNNTTVLRAWIHFGLQPSST